MYITLLPLALTVLVNILTSLPSPLTLRLIPRIVRKKGSCQKERVPEHLVSGANWMPGTAIALVNLSHHSDES